MLFNRLKSSFIYLFFSFVGFDAYAATYHLLVDNNTNQAFYVDSTGNNSFAELEASARDKLYAVEWQTNSRGSTVFLLRFFAANQSYYPIIVMGLKNVEEPRRLKCWSQLYKCSVRLLHEDEGKLIINPLD
jgi:hypothetical protein